MQPNDPCPLGPSHCAHVLLDPVHMLGQTRAVDMYRLRRRGIMEERIIGFKLDIANAAVNLNNASLASMTTSQILDPFAPPSRASKLPQPTPAIATRLAQRAHLGLVSEYIVVRSRPVLQCKLPQHCSWLHEVTGPCLNLQVMQLRLM